jgi:hypothetical protein
LADAFGDLNEETQPSTNNNNNNNNNGGGGAQNKRTSIEIDFDDLDDCLFGELASSTDS